ncbi:hypothetical protein SLA2020_002560 [Shorea laevis]
MKGCNFCILRGRNVSIALIVVGLTTILLWAWEKNPFITTLMLAQYQFRTPSEFLVNASNNSSVAMSPKLHIEQNNVSRLTKETKTMEEISTAPPPMKSVMMFTSDVRDTDRGQVSKNEDCNYAKGRWVADNRRPFYSGFGCKQWLSAMWACRLTQRTDFSFERYRWQPKECKMQEFERFTFLKRMQDKTIAFVGDSLGRQQFQSMMCMATGGEDSPEVENVGWQFGLVKRRGAIRPDGWAYRFPKTNATILYYWSASLSNLVPINATNPISDVAMHLDRPPAFMRQFLHRFDVLVLNTGHHWNRGKLTQNRWVMHVHGTPYKDGELTDIRNAKNFTVHNVVRWLDSQLPLHPRLKVFFRTISPRHFLNGDWNTGGTCNNTTPLTKGSEVLQDESSDSVVEDAVKGTKIKILDITAISVLRDEAHMSGYSIRPTNGMNDCLHWCLPGVPDTWNELLVAQI